MKFTEKDLEYAVRRGLPNRVTAMLRFGVNVNCFTDAGETMCDIAVQTKNVKIYTLLRVNGGVTSEEMSKFFSCASAPPLDVYPCFTRVL